MNWIKLLFSKKETTKQCDIHVVMCRFGFHKWEITKWCRFKDRKCKYLVEEGFNRTCENCEKKQTLKRPKEYHPTKYVWTDSNGI